MLKTLPQRPLTLGLVLLLALTGCAGPNERPGKATTTSAVAEAGEVRVAYFANLTHMQPLVGLHDGTFRRAMGPTVIKTTLFNAGPAEVEAIFAGDIDIGYMGSGPAINGYVKSNGAALRIIAGAVSGGASLVVRADAGISGADALKGKKVASPQAGNTQDVALRYYLQIHGLKTTEQGGNVQIINAANADILSLFRRRQIDGAWMPEPWVSRLVNEAGGKVLVDERDRWPGGDFPTTVVVVRKAFLDKYPLTVQRWLQGHVEVSEWIRAHPEQAQAVLGAEIQRLTGASLAPEVLAQSLARMRVETDPMAASLQGSADNAFALGFLGTSKPDLKSLIDANPLQTVKVATKP